MPRIRTVKPEWLDDERMALASDAARVASIALILLSDDYGNGRANEVMLGSRIFPGNPGKLRGVLAELQNMGFVAFYQVREQTYFTIPHWADHQRVDKPGKPHVPGPCDADCVIPETPAKVPETPGPDLRTYGPMDQGPMDQPIEAGQETSAKAKKPRPIKGSAHDLGAIRAAYPKKQRTKEALTKLGAMTMDSVLYETILSAAQQVGNNWAGHDTQGCPAFGAWVTQERWLDDEQCKPLQPDLLRGRPDEPTRRIKDL